MAAAGYADLSALTLDALRGAAREAYVPAGLPVYVREFQIPGPNGPLTARAYSRASSQNAPLLPGLVFFSAGFYVVGELSGHSALCQQLAVAADCVVVSVAVRLAPEHKFPAAADDAYAATCWIHENADELGIDHRRIAIGGESTGATLATGVCRLAKERRNPPLCFQLLLYPVTDLRAAAVERASRREAQLVTSAVLTKVIELYLGSDAQRADPRCSPLAASNLIGLPPALIISAEDDALTEQVDAYAHMLEHAQVPVTLSRYAGVGHGFVHMFEFVDRGRDALAESAAALRTALHVPFEAETAS
jgi:acetyl esterase